MIALLTNDDGIDADGLAALQSIAARHFDEIWVVAPFSEMSQIGHRVTTDTPIRFESRGERRFAVEGTPADCTRVALTCLLPKRPDWIFSGINHGGNLGRHDFAISGTVAAVREAAFAGVKGITFSHFLRRGLELDWEKAMVRAERAMAALLVQPLDREHFWNVNLPHPEPGACEPKLVYCEQERQPLSVVYEEKTPGFLSYVGQYQERAHVSGSDVDVCFGGDIAITQTSI